MEKRLFGKTRQGRDAWLYSFQNKKGMTMAVTDLPGLHMFSCNDIIDEPGKGGVLYQPRCGICLEPQYYPDSIHNPQFPQCVYKAGQPYRKAVLYRFV